MRSRGSPHRPIVWAGPGVAGWGRLRAARGGRRSADPVRARHLCGDRPGLEAHRGRIARGLEGSEPAVIFHVLTTFPDFFEGPFAHGVVKRERSLEKIGKD